MKVSHTLPITARCPKGNHPIDTYECTVSTDQLIEVETIIKITDSYRTKKIFQEELAQRLANKLKARVTLTGEHSGVLTVVECEPE